MAEMGRCKECNRVLNYPEDDAIVDVQGILCIECGEGKVMKCGCGKDWEWFSDNNGTGVLESYCADCEEDRADKYGCAMIIADMCGCIPNDPCACGCDGSGVLKGV
jgi:hypothetical protein